MKIFMVGLELLHMYQQTDMTKLIDAFRSFVNTHKKLSSVCDMTCVRMHSNRRVKS